jgi:hypothetical protein
MAVLWMYARVSGNGNLRRHASARAGSDSAIAAALTWSPSVSAMKIAAPGKSHSTIDDRIEYWLRIAERLADDAQYLRRCRLLLERFGEFARALLFGLEQPHVLNRNYGLVGECLDQFDLLFGERPDDRTRQRDHADRISFTQ